MNLLIEAARSLSQAVNTLEFESPVACRYNPLSYAWKPHCRYLERFGAAPKRVIFLGMNPGPWGMAQTGVPFGEITHVRDWMGIDEPVARPDPEHPKRLIEGFQCARSEVSGRRLWGLFAERFGDAAAFFKEHFVLNYCPLVFMADSGKNITPDKLPGDPALAALNKACDDHLAQALAIFEPEFAIGVGAYAESKMQMAAPTGTRVGRILHPSPASPAANRDWAGTAAKQLRELGVW